MFNESNEKFRIVCCCFSTIKYIVALSSYSNFPVKLIYCGIVVFFCIDKSMPMSL